MSTRDLPQPSAPFDSGPLSWVMGEIREALGRSRTALFEAGGRAREERATALRHAKSHLHQAHGALQMVDVDGAAMLTQAAEVALERFKENTLDCSVEHAQVVAEAYQALIEYLEELLAGVPPQPLRLFPYYYALQAMLGAARNHPADLFYPNTEAPLRLPPAPPGAVPAVDYTAWRQRFEKALLPFLKSADGPQRLQHAGALRDVLGEVYATRQEAAARRYWFVLHTFADLVAGGQLPVDLYAKQLFGLINLQMRRLSQGTMAQPEGMLRDALFLIAGVPAPTPAATLLRRSWRLDGLLPDNLAARRYGQVDLGALERAKAALARAKAGWGKLTGAADVARRQALRPSLTLAIITALEAVAGAADTLKAPGLATLMRRLAGTLDIDEASGAELDMEVATALLFAEHGLEQIRRLPDDFNANAETIVARLAALAEGRTPPAPSAWQGDLSRQIRQDQTVAALAGEMHTGLRQVEKILDEYDADASKRPALAQIAPLLHQLEGALSILDQDEALRATGQVKDAIGRLALGAGGGAEEAGLLDAIAQNVGALGFFVDMLGHNADAARARFRYDDAAQTFRAIPFEKMAAAEPVPLLDDELDPVAPAAVAAPEPAPYQPPAGQGDAAIEAELLEIFIAEAQEVLAFVATALAQPREQLAAPEQMAMLRRSFHTLKGSGRMVGLNQFAVGADAMERVMNLWLAEQRPMGEALFALLSYAEQSMRDWVEELEARGVSAREAGALVDAAARVQAGGAFYIEAAPEQGESGTIALEEMEDAAPAALAGLQVDEEATLPEAGAEVEALAWEDAALVAEAEAEIVAEAADVDDVEDEAEEGDAVAGDHVAADAALSEAATVSEEAAPDLPELDLPSPDMPAPEQESQTAAEAAAADGEAAQAPPSATPADDAVSEETASGETLPPAPTAPAAPSGNVIEFPTVAAPAAAPSRDDNTKHVGELRIGLPLYNIYLAETDELVRLLAQDFGEWRHEARPVSGAALQAAHTLAGSSATVGFTALRELAHALEMAIEAVVAPLAGLNDAQHDLLEAVIARIRDMLRCFALGELSSARPELVTALAELRDQLRAPAQESELEPADASPEEDADNEAQARTEAQAEAVPAPLIPSAALDDLEAHLNGLFAACYADIVGAAIAGHPLVTKGAAVASPPAAPDVASNVAPPVPAPAAGVAGAPSSDLDALFAAAYGSLSGQGAEGAASSAPAARPASSQADDDIDALFDAFDADVKPAPPPARAPSADDDIDALFGAFAADATPAAPPAAAPATPAADDDIDALFGAFAVQPEPQAPPSDADDPDALFDGVAAAPESEELFASDADAEELFAPALADDEELFGVRAVAAPPPAAVADEDESVALATGEIVYADELDADLLPIFIEEGADLLPQIGQALRAWQHEPQELGQAQVLLRALHTTKGSARMAGAMRLGQHAHEIETHIENMLHAGSATPQAFEELLAHYDHALLLFEQLQHPEAAHAAAPEAAGFAGEPADDDAPPTAGAMPEATLLAADLPAAALHAAASAAPRDAEASGRTALVRVRADILDRLVNQAGEVSISRSRLETEVAGLRASLGEFADNLGRLRRQLREVEMQAESQIASRMSVSSEREFDPLEFDRFTRLQELTRMMAESVNDAGSFHENMTRGVERAGEGLQQQTRLTRDLQRDLMRVRMVPFSSIAERLYRVARQSAKEVDKRVNLDIRGGAVEIDRSVLERMVAPFEHLLRNAIAHGIEARADRTAAGKDETGELLVQVSQQGNEVIIAFSDDGAGLDLARIRAKALDVGLLEEEEELSESEVIDLIYEPGFSTADALTELSGRGVGMDVVRSEAQSLGGRVDTQSETGRGARFTIHLPLTLAVAQVVLISAGGKIYALPAILVEQVQQMKETALLQARASGHVLQQGAKVALHYLPVLLGETGEGDALPPLQRSNPVMLLKSGNDRLALQIDEVVGNREVVIKNIGPQLSRVAGIAGATVLGSGDIVLILNPVALALHLEQHPGLRAATPAAPRGTASGGAGRTVMVVDDSMTVRRVTQRLLEREGYRVLLAKDGVDALEQLQDERPELMLVDIEMPRMDGFDLTRNVRDDSRTRDIPIIMITSRSADKHRNYALELGVDAYFGKPFQEPVLLAAISGLLHRETVAGDAS
jgi:chemosensory pili system protein ChpA (sensor histidine kinase/response regulator)